MTDGRKETALGLGERLRSARKARALTLEQAAHALHLEEGVLVALEEERFSTLGAPVFVRGHLRSYARLLELSEDAVLDAYRVADPTSQALPRVARKFEEPVREGPGPWVIAAVLVLLLFAAVFTYVAQDDAPGDPVAPVLETLPVEVPPAEEGPAPLPLPALPPTGGGDPSAPPSPDPWSAPVPPPAGEPLPSTPPPAPAESTAPAAPGTPE